MAGGLAAMADLGETAQPHRQRARLGRRCALAGSRPASGLGASSRSTFAAPQLPMRRPTPSPACTATNRRARRQWRLSRTSRNVRTAVTTGAGSRAFARPRFTRRSHATVLEFLERRPALEPIEYEVSLDAPHASRCAGLFCVDKPYRLAFDSRKRIFFAVNFLHIGQQPASGRFVARGIEDRIAGVS